ncbi:putative beta-lysine N-acetyltransferase [Desulfohalobiaceae bacterium Ax17]|jgi:putative beta-lysine N-acetyltransferase|uniref:putative beta-lysine N-acetyltransferase n=1 Tax=Desulfovulcanus ferrireducens TaxID=2831190 RepID=UPI00207BB909|nr:putative beta-lysine N-acetyltransferase [Desulfovulcanus ferrireducens]MBT8762367.1 putative beta-lysine N-acetyltransferase [Desulfovulcanus ferrireducens]
MTLDQISTIGKSLVHHGPLSNRVYLIKLTQEDFPWIVDEIDRFAKKRGYTKIIAKVPDYAKDTFLEFGFQAEAFVPRFYCGQNDFYFMGKYFAKHRKIPRDEERINEVLKAAQARSRDADSKPIPSKFYCSLMREKDAEEMSELYKQVFATYPFPIFDPSYIRETMYSNVRYYGIRDGQKLVALSSAEMDMSGKNAEMTDFATLPQYRGKGLAGFLLQYMEREIHKFDIKTAFTIARSVSFGMNIAFAKSGYDFGGTLVNNTNIAGTLESMNVWYKHLASV